MRVVTPKWVHFNEDLQEILAWLDNIDHQLQSADSQKVKVNELQETMHDRTVTST